MNLNSQHHVRGPVRTYVLPSLRVRCVPAHELATPHIDDIDDVRPSHPPIALNPLPPPPPTAPQKRE